MKPVTADQVFVLLARLDRSGSLSGAERARLRRGVQSLAERPPESRTEASVALRRATVELARLRGALAEIHQPLRRGGIDVCAGCSGRDGWHRHGPVMPWPCPTAEAAGLDSLIPAPSPKGPRKGPQGPSERLTRPAGTRVHRAA